MKYELVLFDMDGTILDTLEDLTASLNAALAEAGFPARTCDEVRSFVGNGLRRLIERGVPENTPEDVVDRVFDYHCAYYGAHCADHTRPYAGIPELLERLKGRGVRLAVVSNKADPAVQELSKKYFGDLFDLSVGERPGVARKPAPDSVLCALKTLGSDRANAIYIGDSEVDVATAKNAGLPCIAVDWGFRSREALVAAGASIVVSSPAELEKLLL